MAQNSNENLPLAIHTGEAGLAEAEDVLKAKVKRQKAKLEGETVI